jgi:hypothetical protein
MRDKKLDEKLKWKRDEKKVKEKENEGITENKR